MSLPAILLAQAWIATWAASPQPSDPASTKPLAKLEDQTVRERVRVSVGGDRIRLRLTNEFGAVPLLVGAVTLGVPEDPARVKPGSIRPVTFEGRTSITIPAGAPVLSDPVAFPVATGAEISVSLYFPRRVATPTVHALALKRTVISSRGDHTAEESIDGAAASSSSIALGAVLVPAHAGQRLVAVFGDSLVDGDGSTPETDRGWPFALARRLARAPDSASVAVVAEGLIGNRLLDDCADAVLGCFGAGALARFDRDVLALPGVTHVVLLAGTNDIGFPGASVGAHLLADAAAVRTPEELIDAYRQLIARAHLRGLKVVGATLAPFGGVVLPGYFSDAKEATRQAVNAWIRTGGAFDGVVDFDAVLRDPERPSHLLSKFASRDGLHPNDDGYQAMADAIDLRLFR